MAKGGECAMKYELIDPRQLEPSAYNPRKISGEEMAKLRRSIREFGIVQPILVQMPGNRVIAGHQRVQAAIAEGLAKVPIQRLRVSDAKAKALNLALNRISGEWDDEKLKALLADMADLERNLSGFDEDEIEKLLGASLEGRAVEEMQLKPPPEIVWFLIGIPMHRFGEVQQHVAALESAAELTVQSSREFQNQGAKS
jgi:ParB-like chromosome segregation protein Spo0J